MPASSGVEPQAGLGAQGPPAQSNRGRRVNGQLNKLQRKRARKRDDATHQASRTLADTAHTVVVEDSIRGHDQVRQGHGGDTRQAGQAEVGAQPQHPGERLGLVGAQAAYKAGDLRKVNPAYTSQRCSRCGHVDQSNRPSQAVFACGACGFRANADHNAPSTFGACGASVRTRFGPRDRGFCTARGDPVGSPTTRERDAGRLHLNGFGLEANQPAQVVLVPGGRQRLLAMPTLRDRSCRSRLCAMRLRMAMLWAA